jgi:hypothetical protein
MFQEAQEQHTGVPEDSSQHFTGRQGYFIIPYLQACQAVSTPRLITYW